METHAEKREGDLLRAEKTLPDRVRFGLNVERREAFGAVLSAPYRPAPRLAAPLKQPRVFEHGEF
jgi:uncharacterized protein (DUF1778 family)